MRIPVIFLLTLILAAPNAVGQQTYNACPNAFEICPNQVYTADNLGANVTFCPGCEDDFNYCFTTDNTIWFTFTTNAAGGDVQVDFSNLVFELNPGQDTELQATMIEMVAPCSSGSYTQLGNCVSNATGNFSLNVLALPPATTYYIVVDGDNTGAGITDPAECTFDIIISGTGVDRPVSSAGIIASNDSICQNDVVTFSASLTDCPDNGDYNWFINGVLTAVTTLPDFQTSSLNDGDTVTVETSCYAQCPAIVSADSPPISVYTFNVYAGEDQTIDSGETISLIGVTTAPVYVWSPAYLFSDPNALNTFAIPTQTVILTLAAEENGCTQYDYVTITVTTTLSIPNTFSPNGDNTNETWIIEGIELYPNCLMKIYNRWGQQVFESTGYSVLKAWDGKIKSGMASEGVYYYVLDLREEGLEAIKGSITLIR